MGLPRGDIVPDQPHSFCDEMSGSMDEERVISSLTSALGKALMQIPTSSLQAVWGEARAVWLEGGSRVQALTGGHYAVIVFGSRCWGQLSNFTNPLHGGMEKLLSLADDTRLMLCRAQLLLRRTSIT